MTFQSPVLVTRLGSKLNRTPAGKIKITKPQIWLRQDIYSGAWGCNKVTSRLSSTTAREDDTYNADTGNVQLILHIPKDTYRVKFQAN